MMRCFVTWAGAVLMAMPLLAAPAAATFQPAVKNNFPRPPAAAVTALNKTVGKPFSAGYVFIDGKYIKPPYTVERYGTVVRINGCQVTAEIVPWEEFVKTQSGVTVTKTETPAASDDSTSAAAPEPDPEPEVEEDDDDSESSLDDLFDDDPKPKKSAAKKPAKKKVVKPKPKKPATVVSYSFDGSFAHNERSKALLGKVNAVRTKIDSQLRSGGNFFFSARYSNVSGDAGTSKRIIERLPEIMKKNSDREAFGMACRQAGLSYLPHLLLDDLHKNRFDYLQLLERRKAEQSKTQWQSLLGE